MRGAGAGRVAAATGHRDCRRSPFPASLLKVAGNIVPLILLAIYISRRPWSAGEFEWGTVRTLHLTSQPRPDASRSGSLVDRRAGRARVARSRSSSAAILPFLLCGSRARRSRVRDTRRRTCSASVAAPPRGASCHSRPSRRCWLGAGPLDQHRVPVDACCSSPLDLALAATPFWPIESGAVAPRADTERLDQPAARRAQTRPIARRARRGWSVGALLAWAHPARCSRSPGFRRLDLNE